jgi:hypothetical protein
VVLVVLLMKQFLVMLVCSGMLMENMERVMVRSDLVIGEVVVCE